MGEFFKFLKKSFLSITKHLEAIREKIDKSDCINTKHFCVARSEKHK